MNKKVKILMMILGIVVLAVLYGLYSSNSADTSNKPIITSSGSRDENSFSEGKELLEMLTTLKSVKLDTSFFGNKTFQSLIDFSVEIKSEPSGRTNPFSPLDETESVAAVEEVID